MERANSGPLKLWSTSLDMCAGTGMSTTVIIISSLEEEDLGRRRVRPLRTDQRTCLPKIFISLISLPSSSFPVWKCHYYIMTGLDNIPECGYQLFCLRLCLSCLFIFVVILLLLIMGWRDSLQYLLLLLYFNFFVTQILLKVLLFMKSEN